VLWLLHSGRPGVDAGYRLRRFSTRRGAFGKARTVVAPEGLNGAIGVDPRGEAHVIYQLGRTFYRRTRRHGRVLTRPSRLNFEALLENPRLAVGGHRRGLLVSGGSTPGIVSALWLPRR
jgi:hypothetical protein